MIAPPDQRDMGFSDRLAHRGLPRHSGNGDDYLALEDRITDLQELLTVLIPEAEHPVFTLGHDWGGVISLGAALRAHQAGSHHLAGLMTLNTAVHQSEDDPLPAPLRCAIH